MFDSPSRRNAVLAALGGLAWVVIWGLHDAVPGLLDAAVVVPVLLGFGVLEAYCRHDDEYGTTGRAGVLLLSLGLLGSFLGALLWATLPENLVRIFVVAVPSVAGVVLAALGSGLLAVALYRIGLLSWPTALLFGLALPLTLVADALVAPLLGVGVALYGVAWIPVGYRLWATTGEDLDGVDRSTTGVIPGPQAVVAGLAGAFLLLVGLVAASPGGPVGRLPVGSDHPAMVGLYLVTGVAGLAAGAGATVGLVSPRATRAYNVVVGGVYLLVVVAVLGGFATHATLPVVSTTLGNSLLYLPVGAVLATVGVAVGPDEDRRSERGEVGVTAE